MRRGLVTAEGDTDTGQHPGDPEDNGEQDTSESWAERGFEDKVDDELFKLQVRAEAKRRFDQDRAGPTHEFDQGLLSEILDRPNQSAFRIHDVMPSEGGLLVVAQRKTGKTTLELNLARSLITAEPFLGEFSVVPVTGRVAILNYEVSASQLGHWAQEVGVPEDRLFLVTLRGRPNPLASQQDREVLASTLREYEVETLIIDPFGSAYTGSSQNDPGEVRRWLDDLHRCACTDCGVRDLILTAHAGWAGERVRGASALEDWADSIITMIKNDDGSRYLKAIGRDVSVDEDLLHYDPQTRLLTMTGSGNRVEAARNDKARQLIPHVVDCVRKNPGLSQARVEKAMKERRGEVGTSFQNQDVRKSLGLAKDAGRIRIEGQGGPGKPMRHYPIDLVQPESPPDPSGRGSQ